MWRPNGKRCLHHERWRWWNHHLAITVGPHGHFKMLQDIIAVFRLQFWSLLSMQTRFKAKLQKPIQPQKILTWKARPSTVPVALERKRLMAKAMSRRWQTEMLQHFNHPKHTLDHSSSIENWVILVLNHHKIFGWDQSTNPEHCELTPDPPGRQGLQSGKAATWFQPSKSAESILMVRYTVIWKFLHGCLGKLGLRITLLNLPQAKPAPRPHGALDFVLWGLEWLGVRSRGSQQWKKTLAKTFFYKNSIKESRCSFLVSHATPWRLQLNLWRFETSSGALVRSLPSTTKTAQDSCLEQSDARKLKYWLLQNQSLESKHLPVGNQIKKNDKFSIYWKVEGNQDSATQIHCSSFWCSKSLLIFIRNSGTVYWYTVY